MRSGALVAQTRLLVKAGLEFRQSRPQLAVARNHQSTLLVGIEVYVPLILFTLISQSPTQQHPNLAPLHQASLSLKVFVTADSEHYTAVDISGARSAPQIRESILSKVHDYVI